MIELIFHWYAIEGLSIVGVADRLMANGIPSPSDVGRASKKRKNKKRTWNVQSIAGIIKNETYAGIWRYAKKITVNGKQINNPVKDDSLAVSVPAIISREVWEAAQERLRQNKENARRNRRHEYLLSNRCTCAHCDHKIIGRTMTTPKRTYSYYYCPAYEGRYVKDCDMPFFSADKVDAIVWGWVEEVLTDETKLGIGMNDYRADIEKRNNPAREELKIVEGLISENRENLSDEMINLRLVKGEIAKAEIAHNINRIEETMNRLEARRADLLAQIEVTELTDEQILSIKQFAAELRADMETIRADYKSRRDLLALINLQARFTIEDGEKIVYITAKIGPKRLPIASIAFYGQLR